MKIPPKSDDVRVPIVTKVLADLRYVFDCQVHASGPRFVIVVPVQGASEFGLWIDDLCFSAIQAPGGVGPHSARLGILRRSRHIAPGLHRLEVIEQPHPLAQEIDLLLSRLFLLHRFPHFGNWQLESLKIIHTLGQLPGKFMSIGVKTRIGKMFVKRQGKLQRLFVIAVANKSDEHAVTMDVTQTMPDDLHEILVCVYRVERRQQNLSCGVKLFCAIQPSCENRFAQRSAAPLELPGQSTLFR